jgi:carotenoid 1,2-hydratase
MATPPTDAGDAAATREAPFRFDRPLVRDGYVWWYVDALSDDGRHGLTIIALLGTVFSPYYARARRRGPTDPLEYSALNVALYGATGRRWSMTERDAAAVMRSAQSLRIGPSTLSWDGARLRYDIDEFTAPWPSRLRGRVTVQPFGLASVRYPLDAAARHHWQPLAPRARVRVEFDSPRVAWEGDAYLDSNDGERPLEADFARWTWCRATAGDTTTVFYDVEPHSGAARSLALEFDGSATARSVDAPPMTALPGTIWGIERQTRCDRAAQPAVIETLEDGPFYARSLIAKTLAGRPVRAVHESLSLRRFESRWVQLLLPVRMPRRRSG